MAMGNHKQSKMVPKVRGKSAAIKAEQPGADKVGAQPHTPRSRDCAKVRLARHVGVSVLFEKYTDRRTGNIVVTRLVDGMGFTKKSLADTLGISVGAMCHADQVNSPAMQTRMREMLEILGRVTDWAGSEVQAMAWYRAQPIPALGGRTAESLVKSDQAAPLRDYLDHMAMGGFA